MPTKPERPRLLVPFDGSAAAEHVLRVACRAARRDDAPLVVLCVVPVPADREADEMPSEAGALVMRALVRAQTICNDEGVVAVFEQTYARNLADEIVAVADAMHACLIALPLDYRGAGETKLMSPTVQQVLTEAHCTVMLDADSQPINDARGSSYEGE
jgi:nucleotide-binding universal stress UspA family protein